MADAGSILLTGATGLLGRYLLRALLLAGRPVAVLVRDTPAARAPERVAQLLAGWGEVPARKLPAPVVLAGDVRLPGLGLQAAERAWLAAHCRAVVHAAARITLRSALDGESWKTNVEGTQHVLDLCAALGLPELHHVSTAFVCGNRTGPVRENERDCGQRFHNDYERSKLEAEQRVRRTPGLRSTVYRPAVIVGDSRTGYTSSYHGFYRFLDLADRLAEPSGTGRRFLPLRLPLSGQEPRNLVPVDWVAQAIVRIVQQPGRHGSTYHLVARQPVRAREIKEVATELLKIDGVQWAGSGGPADPTPLEQLFLGHLEEYEPYLHGDPVFDDRNTRAALAGFPPPRVDRAVLARLIRFAIADRWGQSSRAKPGRRGRVDCAAYVERFFPESVRKSTLARIPLDVAVAFDVRGPGGGRWTCRFSGGELVDIRRGHEDVEVIYRLDVATFEAVVRGEQSPHEAFYAQRIEIEGNVEKGLKLAVLFGQFVREFPYQSPAAREAVDAGALAV